MSSGVNRNQATRTCNRSDSVLRRPLCRSGAPDDNARMAVVSLRRMTMDDVEAGLRLCRLSSWNQVARDWEQFLRLEPDGATVAVRGDGRIVGSVATIRYCAAASESWSQPPPAGVPTVAWIAMVLVDPVERGQGVGTALLHRGLARVEEATVAGLDATALGRPLYEKLGFSTETTLTRMARAAQGSAQLEASAGLEASAPLSQPGDPQNAAMTEAEPASTPGRTRPVSEDDMDELAQLDAAATGLDRRAMLQWLLEGAPDLAWRTHSPALDGYVLGRRGHNFIHLGPLSARNVTDALALVCACVAGHPDADIILDAADEQPGWREGLEAMGFAAQRSFARMYRGDWRPTADPRLLFASIGPEFG